MSRIEGRHDAVRLSQIIHCSSLRSMKLTRRKLFVIRMKLDLPMAIEASVYKPKIQGGEELHPAPSKTQHLTYGWYGLYKDLWLF